MTPYELVRPYMGFIALVLVWVFMWISSMYLRYVDDKKESGEEVPTEMQNQVEDFDSGFNSELMLELAANYTKAKQRASARFYCIGCGAPVDTTKHNCPYCKMTYHGVK